MGCISKKTFGILCLIVIASYLLYAISSGFHIQHLIKTVRNPPIPSFHEQNTSTFVDMSFSQEGSPANTTTVNEGTAKITFSQERNTPKVTEMTFSKEGSPAETTSTPVTSQEKIANWFEEVLKPSSHEYLCPVNSFKDFTSKSTMNQSRIKELMADVFRTGYRLTPFVTEDGMKGLMENGVVYRPIRQELKLMSSHSNVKIDHPTDFEHYVPYDKNVFFSGRTIPSEEELAKPKIILWYDRIGYVPSYIDLQPLRVCPDFPCRITSNRKFAEHSSAFVFDRGSISRDVPKRRPDQVFIFHDVERPPDLKSEGGGTISLPVWRSVFNWTMSNRMDSDIQTFYGIIRKRLNPPVKNYASLISKKTKLVASTIGHCGASSRREDYIKRLDQYIKVDVYGSCGRYKCPRGTDTQCGRSIGSQYKFYLGFENTICDGYVTEKLFRYMSLDLIVVVRGGANYLQHMPPEIFINAADYKSPQHLAERLNYLDQHPAEYEAILREKDKYMVLYEAWYHANSKGDISYSHYHYEAVPFCRICHRLWNLESYTNTIPDIKAWFYNYTCSNPQTSL